MVLSRTLAPQHNGNTASFPPSLTYLSEYQVASIVQEANHACFLVPENNLSCPKNFVEKNLLESKDQRGATEDSKHRQEHQNRPLEDGAFMLQRQSYNRNLCIRKISNASYIATKSYLGAACRQAEVAGVQHHTQYFQQVEHPSKREIDRNCLYCF